MPISSSNTGGYQIEELFYIGFYLFYFAYNSYINVNIPKIHLKSFYLKPVTFSEFKNVGITISYKK